MDLDTALTVTEINELVKAVICENLDKKLYVSGEISNVKKSNGNVYFSLKDANSIINVVFWRVKDLEFENGENVIISGKLTCFTKQGTYNFTGQSIQKSQAVNLENKFEKLKEEFTRKGYFSKKKKMPSSVKKLGILTSLEGAALQDILFVLRNNNFTGDVYVKNCFVQGVNCPLSVKEGIEYFNNIHKRTPLDALIITRGGGSIEDLMGYSTEEVVKAINGCEIYTISAIGHEIDTMLSDLAADYRAPTPSIAAETITKIQGNEMNIVNVYLDKIKNTKYIIERNILDHENKLLNLQRIHKSFSTENLINNEINKLDNLLKSIISRTLGTLDNSLYELERLKAKSNMYNKSKIFKSGYVIITNKDGDLVDSIEDFKKNMENCKIVFKDGVFDMRIHQ
jgi:exodeoxyribonuclease VII large subunit